MTDVRTEAEIRQWLIARLSDRLQLPVDQIAVDQPIASFGLDSMQSVVLIGELEDFLGRRFDANPLIDHPSIERLSRFLAGHP